MTDRQSDRVEPKLGLESVALDVHMNRFRMVSRIKVEPVWSESKSRRQRSGHGCASPRGGANGFRRYSTVTLFAKFLGWSTSQPRRTAM